MKKEILIKNKYVSIDNQNLPDKIGKIFPFLKKLPENTKQKFAEKLFYVRKGIFRKKIIRNYLASTDCPKLHVACGVNYILKGWLNVDIVAGDVYCNVCKKLPFADNSFMFIFNEAMIEHLELNEATDFLKEIYRILKPGGIFRVRTPNLKKYIECYMDLNKDITFDDISNYLKLYLKQDFSRCEMINILWNRCLRGHKFIFDYDTLYHILEEVGFKNVISCKRNCSNYQELQNIGSPNKMCDAYPTIGDSLDLLFECRK